MNDLTAIEVVSNRNLSLVEQAGLVEITNDDENEQAGRMLGEVLRAIKDIEEGRLEITRPLDLAKSRAMEAAKRAQAPFKDAEEHLRGEILGYRVEQERLLEEERASLEAAASLAAEDGRLDDADEKFTELMMVPEKANRAPGTSMQTRWSAEVTSLQDLVLAVASGEAPLSLLLPNMPALNKMAQATRGPSPIRGVQYTSTKTLAASAR